MTLRCISWGGEGDLYRVMLGILPDPCGDEGRGVEARGIAAVALMLEARLASRPLLGDSGSKEFSSDFVKGSLLWMGSWE